MTTIPPRLTPARRPDSSSPRWAFRRGRTNAWLPGLALGLVLGVGAATINPPLGPHTHPGPDELARATRFSTNDPVVLTSYFYWYDIHSNAHILNADGSNALTDHPPTLTDFTYKSPAWHRRELEDMIAAGIDVLLPVYWGEPSQRLPGKPALDQPWSFSGLPPLLQAREALLAAGAKPPAIGLFYDTSTLEHNVARRRVDLTTDEGRRWFYESIRDFFSLIPARHWATIEGRPIVFLYSAGFAAAHDQSCIDYLRQEFARDFSGVQPYVVREISWNVQADNTYAWGGAISLRNPGVGALGPGYDHSAVPGREPLVVPRENGAFFERNWTRFLRNPSKLVHIETWNEYHEGTDIAASREYGRQYLELNRKFVDLFKAGIKPPRPLGPYSEFKSVSVLLQATNDARGLTQFEFADGATVPAEIDGRACRLVAPTVHAGRYVYFQIADSFKWTDRMLVDVEVEYFDQGSGSFRLEYDGPDPNAPFNGAYTASKTLVTLANSGQWKVAKFRLPESRFLNSQNGGADFRVNVQGSPLHVRQVTVTRLGLPVEAGTRRRGWQQDFADPLATNWMVRGEAESFRQSDGMLQAGPVPVTGAGFLLASVALGSTDALEVLARLRPVSPEPSPNWLGGVARCAPSDTGDAFGALLRRAGDGSTAFGLIHAGDNFGPFVPVTWETNRWHWLRLRPQPNALTGRPELRARLWPADGETPEPDTWTTSRDYLPTDPAVVRLPGIAAGQGAIEYDYFLLTGEGLPEIEVRLPAFKARRARLHSPGFAADEGWRIQLRGEGGTSYRLEHSPDLVAWAGDVVTTDSAGLASYVDRMTTNLFRRFYRARLQP